MLVLESSHPYRQLVPLILNWADLKVQQLRWTRSSSHCIRCEHFESANIFQHWSHTKTCSFWMCLMFLLWNPRCLEDFCSCVLWSSHVCHWFLRLALRFQVFKWPFAHTGHLASWALSSESTEETEETGEDDVSLLKLSVCLTRYAYVSWIQLCGIPILRSSNAAPFEAILRLLWYPYLVSDA